MSGVFKHICGGLFQHFQGTLPDRAVQHTGLTETAAADAATLNLQNYTILGDLDKRNQRLFRIEACESDR